MNYLHIGLKNVHDFVAAAPRVVDNKILWNESTIILLKTGTTFIHDATPTEEGCPWIKGQDKT